jgi:hypothetical protein
MLCSMRLYTLKEAVPILRKSEEWLRDWLREHPDCCLKAGRDILVSEADLERIVAYWQDESLRRAGWKVPKRTAQTTDELTLEQKLARLRELGVGSKRKRSPRRSNPIGAAEALEDILQVEAEKKKATAKRKRIPKISVSTPAGDRREPDPRRGPNAPRIRIHPRFQRWR